MQQIIEQLYKGELYPCDEVDIKVSEYSARFKNASKVEFNFKEQLSETMQAELDNMIEEQNKVKATELTQAFVDGFKLASKLIIESLSP